MSSDVTSPVSLSHFAPPAENTEPPDTRSTSGPPVENSPAPASAHTPPPTANSLLHSTAELGTTSAGSGSSLRTTAPSFADKEDMSQPSMKILAGIGLCVVIAGVATGWGMSQLRAGNQLFTSGGGQGPAGELTAVPQGSLRVGQVFGSEKTEIFKDTTEGVLQIGGLDGEGTHKLLRAGGVSQTVYLTSSVTDLDKFENTKVKVWGETFKGEKAGWLMDVGRIEVIELNAKAP